MSSRIVERRNVPTVFEVRSVGDKLTFEGYALKWETKSQNLGGFREKVARGATNKTIQEADIRALINHDPNLILGRNKAGTLDLSNDDTGTYYRVSMPDTSYARDLAVSMERGDVSQSSFAMRVIDDSWAIDEDDFPIRTLNEIALYDVSPVTYPAYVDSTSGLGSRALERLAETRGLAIEQVTEHLRAVILGEPVDAPEPEATVTTRTEPIEADDYRERLSALRSMVVRARLIGSR